MTRLEEFAEKLKKLAAEAPPIAIVMPPNSVGLPEGTFIPEALLSYIADCLLCKVN